MRARMEGMDYKTESVCPVCLRALPAELIQSEAGVTMLKTCPEHGEFKTVVWREPEGFGDWNIPSEFTPPLTALTKREKGCPHDCGTCNEHKQQACCVLLEVTHNCNQNCPYCYASAAGHSEDPSFEAVVEWMKYLREIGEERPFNIQLSGGEPTLRDDLPELIRMAKSMGFPYVQLNTNGKRLADDADYLRALKEAGLSSVFLQFDGTQESIYEAMRGEPLLKRKIQALERCVENGLGTVLVPTLVPGVNDQDIGAIIRFGLKYLPTVKGIHFQPASYFGRFPCAPADKDRMTLPEVMQLIEEQMSGAVKKKHFRPLQSGNPLCSFTGSFTLMENGELVPVKENGGCCGVQTKSAALRARNFVLNKWVFHDSTSQKSSSESQCDFGEWDAYIRRIRDYGFSISGMAFQDAWNMDLNRLKACTIHIFHPETRRLIPFCAYNLTDTSGNPLYRR